MGYVCDDGDGGIEVVDLHDYKRREVVVTPHHKRGRRGGGVVPVTKSN